MPNPTIDELVKTMKGHKALHGWDAAVSYDLNELNKAVTKNLWENTEIWGDIPLNVEDKVNNVTMLYTMQLYQPKIEFLPQERKARLTMSLRGEVDLGKGQKTTIHSGAYVMEAKVPIVGIHNWDGKMMTDEEKKARVVSVSIWVAS